MIIIGVNAPNGFNIIDDITVGAVSLQYKQLLKKRSQRTKVCSKKPWECPNNIQDRRKRDKIRRTISWARFAVIPPGQTRWRRLQRIDRALVFNNKIFLLEITFRLLFSVPSLSFNNPARQTSAVARDFARLTDNNVKTLADTPDNSSINSIMYQIYPVTGK